MMYWRQPKPVAEKKSTLEILSPAIPAAVWLFGALVLLLVFRGPVEQLLARTTKFKVAGVELEAATKAIERSTKQVQAIPEAVRKELSRDDPLRASLVRRWAEMRMAERLFRILLLHDRIEVARALRHPFASLGFTAHIGLCATEAESLLRRHAYDAGISDINWHKCPDGESQQLNGTGFLSKAYHLGIAQPTVFYISNFDASRGTPPYAVGISNNWYEVLHLVLDVISRKDWTPRERAHATAD
jgi:hypothetical protein